MLFYPINEIELSQNWAWFRTETLSKFFTEISAESILTTIGGERLFSVLQNTIEFLRQSTLIGTDIKILSFRDMKLYPTKIVRHLSIVPLVASDCRFCAKTSFAKSCSLFYPKIRTLAIQWKANHYSVGFIAYFGVSNPSKIHVLTPKCRPRAVGRPAEPQNRVIRFSTF